MRELEPYDLDSIVVGDCLDMMAEMPDNCVDTIITDPPYALTDNKNGSSGGFMGKKWDSEIPGTDVWRECLRIAKPGAFLLAFGGTRTHHRLMCAIEDAGWEIRDCMMMAWVQGSGFPKSIRLDLDASRALPEDAFCQCDANRHNNEHTYPVQSVLDHIRTAQPSSVGADDSLSNVICGLDKFADFQGDYLLDPHSDDEPLLQAAKDALAFALLPEYVQEHIHSGVRVDDLVYEPLHSLCRVLCTDLLAMRDYLHPASLPLVSELLQVCKDGSYPEVDLSKCVSKLAGSLDVSVVMAADRSVFRRLHIHSLVFCLPLSFSRILCYPKADTIIPQSEYCASCGKIWNRWRGFGSALKPSIEPIVVAMAPRDGTFAENALKWSVAGLWVDGARIGTEDKLVAGGELRPNSGDERKGAALGMFQQGTPNTYVQHPQGRWPANFLLCHHPECKRRGVKRVRPAGGDIAVGSKGSGPRDNDIYGKDDRPRGGWTAYKDPDGLETVADWDCHPACPVRILGEQSGESKSSGGRIGNKNGGIAVPGGRWEKGDPGFGDSGTAARFFWQGSWEYEQRELTDPLMQFREGLSEDEKRYVMNEIAKMGNQE